jgi:hypothetical protein
MASNAYAGVGIGRLGLIVSPPDSREAKDLRWIAQVVRPMPTASTVAPIAIDRMLRERGILNAAWRGRED